MRCFSQYIGFVLGLLGGHHGQVSCLFIGIGLVAFGDGVEFGVLALGVTALPASGYSLLA
jgi:hypothetical protein